MVTVKTIRFALPSMVPVLPVNPAGPVHSATARVRLVTTVTVARRSVHVAGAVNPVTQKLGDVGGVTPDGLDPGVCVCEDAWLQRKGYTDLQDQWRVFHCFRPVDHK